MIRMKYFMKRQIVIFILFAVISIIFYVQVYATMSDAVHPIPVRAVDTMKYSRDVAREKLSDTSFDAVIEKQVSQIAYLGASHVSISTPYDEEFIPFMKRWVSTARKYGLSVWFRGNLSGWEGWFGYGKVTEAEHTQKIEQFILNNPELFEDGDIFTSCPECENGGPGDPRYGDVYKFRQFLINEYKITKAAFKQIKKDVIANYYSMNGDVARLVMDKAMVKALDGVITIDHYVGSPDKLIEDIKEYAKRGAGKVVLGEMGAPIPDIHGNMTEEQQAIWLAETFAKLSTTTEVIGINYWVNVGGSTALWAANGVPRKGAEVLKNFYSHQIIKGKIVDNENFPITDAVITVNKKTYNPAKNGTFQIPYLLSSQTIEVKAPGYNKKTVVIDNTQKLQTITLENDGTNPENKNRSLFARLIRLFTSPFNL